MASKTAYIPRFLLPQHGPMWRAAAVGPAFGRSLNGEVGQVTVRYASGTASTRPSAARSTAARVPTRRTAYTKSTPSKAVRASAPTKPLSKNAVKTPGVKAAAPKPAAAPAATPKPAAAPKPTAAPAPAPAAPARPAAVDPSKPIVLEKPERFNPPSHGARLPRSTPRHYGGSPTVEEVKAQSRRTYPGLPPPPNTWSHWFINSRGIHLFITLGTLTAMATYTFVANFQAKSEFADLIPPISELPRHPFQYVGACLDVLRMHEEHESSKTAEKRRRRVDDVDKRNEYRKAHGLEPATSGLFGASLAEPPAEESADAAPAAATPAAASAAAASPDAAAPAESSEPVPVPGPAAEITPEGKRKKFMGIF